MKLKGDHTFKAPRDRVWQALLDPDVLVNTLPGCERLEETGENQYDGTLNIQVGPVSGRFDGKVELLDLEPEESYRLKLSGKGAPGFVHGEGLIELEDAEGGGTKLSYDVDTQVGGRIASVGQRLLQSSSKVITRQALEGLEQQIEARESGASQTGVGTGERVSADPQAATVVQPTAEPVSGSGDKTDSSDSSDSIDSSSPSDSKAADSGDSDHGDEAQAAGPRQSAPPQAATVVQPTANPSSGTATESGRRVSRPTGTSQPSQAEFAAQFAKGLFEEMVPKPYRPWVLGGLVLAFVSLIVSLGSRR